MVWLAVTRAPIWRSRASVARISKLREAGSSISSQWTSTSLSYLSARAIRKWTDSHPYSVLNSKWGIPPTTSTPSFTACSISSFPWGKLKIPSCGKATSWSSKSSFISSRNSKRAWVAIRWGSVTSTWLRTCWIPWPIMFKRVALARRLTSALVRSFLRSLQIRIPSKRVPVSFHSGSPAVKVESRWTWESTKGGKSSLPCPSITSSPTRALKLGAIWVKRPFSIKTSVNWRWLLTWTFLINMVTSFLAGGSSQRTGRLRPPYLQTSSRSYSQRLGAGGRPRRESR